MTKLIPISTMRGLAMGGRLRPEPDIQDKFKFRENLIESALIQPGRAEAH